MNQSLARPVRAMLFAIGLNRFARGVTSVLLLRCLPRRRLGAST